MGILVLKRLKGVESAISFVKRYGLILSETSKWHKRSNGTLFLLHKKEYNRAETGEGGVNHGRVFCKEDHKGIHL